MINFCPLYEVAYTLITAIYTYEYFVQVSGELCKCCSFGIKAGRCSYCHDQYTNNSSNVKSRSL